MPEIFQMDAGEPTEEPTADAGEPDELDMPETTDQEAIDEIHYPRAQGPRENHWRCLRCDSDNWTRNLYGTYLCRACESTEFYSSREPHRRITPDGIWMFMPRTGGADAAAPRDGETGPPPATPPLSRRRRRQLRRQQQADAPPPPSEPDTTNEWPESETLTFDPTVEPDPADLPAPPRPLPARTPTTAPLKKTSCPASPPSSFGAATPNRTATLPKASSATPAPWRPTGLLEAEDGAAGSLHRPGSSGTPSWKSRMGPEKGVRWRGGAPPTPPTWKYDSQDPRAYSKYAKKVALWRIQVASYMTPREAALLLYTSLSGEAETELEHAPIEAINSDKGIDYILDALKAPMEQKLVFQKRKFLNEYENIQRQQNEGLRAYSNRYRRAERNLRAVGVEVAQMYDDDSRGNRLLDRARLSPQDQRLILVGSRYSLAFEDIAESMHMQYPEFRSAPPVFGRDGQPLGRKGDGKGKDGAPGATPATGGQRPKRPPGGKGTHPRRVFLAEHAEDTQLDEIPEETADNPDEDHDDQAEDHDAEGAEADDPDDIDPDEQISEALDVLTVTAKKLNGLRLGRKFSGGPGKPKPDIATQKKTSHCVVCGQVGHWKGDEQCPGTPAASAKAASSSTAPPARTGRPDPKEKRGPHQAFFVKDYGAIEITDQDNGNGAPAFGTAFQVNVVFEVQAAHPRDPGFDGLMVLDTACQRTCCGQRWLQAYTAALDQVGLQPHATPFQDVFQFGTGKPVTAANRSYLPVGIGGTDLLVGTGALSVEIPLLASNSLLDQLGMVLDMPNNTVTFATLSTTVPLLRVGGHLTVCISEFSGSKQTWKSLQQSVDWNDPPPELVVQGELAAPSRLTSSPAVHARPDGPACDPSAMAAQVAAVREGPPRLQPPLLRDDDHGGSPGHASGQRLRGRAAPAGQQVRAPAEHMPASRLCPVRKCLREVRSVQTVPKKMEVERRSTSMDRTSGSRLRLQTARFAASLAVFLQYCFSSFGVGSVDPVPAFDPSFLVGGDTQEVYDGEAYHTPREAEQWQRDGGRPVEAHPGGLGLQLGRCRRLKGEWKKSAKTLEHELNIYDKQPSAFDRPPQTVDLLVVYSDHLDIPAAAADLQLTSVTFPKQLACRLPNHAETRQQAQRALRRLRPHVLYLSFLDRPLGDNENDFVTELIEEQTGEGRAVVMIGPAGPLMRTVGLLPGVNTHDFGQGHSATTLLTTVPGATTWFSSAPGREAEFDYHVTPLLYMIRDYVRSREPSRFGIYQAFVTYRSPVTRLEEWDEIADTLARSFGTPGTRPFYIDPSSEMGRKIADLFRIKLERVQAVQTPSQRRLPQDVPFTARGAFLVHNDGTKTIELEDLSLVHQPKQRFAKPVRYGLLVYGHLIPETEPDQNVQPSAPISGLPTDISFPGLSPQVPVEVRRSIARAHINMGHPTAQELTRLANAAGSPSSMFIEAIRKLECATCARLQGPQAPRPATTAITATQFGDRVEADVFYLRDLKGQSCMILGAVDVATRFHQAAILPSRDPEDAYRALEAMWVRPFGLMVQIGLDPDTTFQGSFQEHLRSHGVMVDYCPAEAHWQIGHVERQNAFLRTVLEKLVDTFAATGVSDIQLLLAPALHAVNSMTLSRGRSAFQAVFGKIPRLPGGLFTDFNSLATTPIDDPAATAEIIRSEALKAICDMNVRQSFRRALLRKTHNTKVPQLEPGQACSFWRWRKRGLKKRGGWVTARFLSWDPASPGKMAWVRSGTTTALVAVEQLRAATGFEAWLPTEPDVAALKDASQKLDQTLWADESGPPPPLQHRADEDDYHPDIPMGTAEQEITAAMASAPSAPTAATSSTTPPGPGPEASTSVRLEVLDQSQNQQSTLVYQPTVQNTFVRNTARLGEPSQASRRGGSVPRTPRGTPAPRTPRTPRTPRSRSPLPPAVHGPPPEPRQLPQELPEPPVPEPVLESVAPPEPQQLPEELPEPPVPPALPTPLEVGWESAPFDSAGYETDFEPEPLPSGQPDPLLPQAAGAPPEQQGPSASSSAAHTAAADSATGTAERPPTTPVSSQPSNLETEAPALLPAKRPFDALTTLYYDEDIIYHCVPGTEPAEGYGAKPDKVYQSYLNSEYRLDDLGKDTGEKVPQESDTSDSDWDDQPPGKQPSGMSRAEAKALDREIPWRRILELDQPDLQAYIKSVEKEAKSWEEWGSVKALSHQEAHRILRDRILCKRVLRTRSCFRDKSKGLGPLQAKCRVVALGHKDPDIYKLNRECATPNRTSEHVLFTILTAGSNGEFGENKRKWKGWSGDASTAFLQGDIASSERDMPLYLLPPSDGVTELTSCWKAPLYLVCTNVYGLSNAPRLWSLTVIKRLCDLGYRQHSFDKMVFIKFNTSNELMSIIIVYVDDFLGAFRSDYNIDEVHQAFKWGALQFFRARDCRDVQGQADHTTAASQRKVLPPRVSKRVHPRHQPRPSPSQR